MPGTGVKCYEARAGAAWELLHARQAEAAEAFQRAITLKPDFAEAYYQLATVEINLGKMAESVAHLEKYLALNPSNPQNVATAKALLPSLKAAVK